MNLLNILKKILPSSSSSESDPSAIGLLEKRLQGIVNSDFYLRTYPDIAAAKVDPVTHYLRSGILEGRKPCALFDPHWYKQQYSLAEVSLAPLHYCSSQGSNNDPHPAFDSKLFFSFATTPSTDQTALEYYLSSEKRASNSICLLFDQNFIESHHGQNISLDDYLEDPKLWDIHTHACFDPVYYRSQYEDLSSWQASPLLHFLLFGDKEKRSPHPLFDPIFYLQQIGPLYPEAHHAPLKHYLSVGHDTCFWPHPLFDPLCLGEKADGTPAGSLQNFLSDKNLWATKSCSFFDPKVFSNFAAANKFKDGANEQEAPLVQFLKMDGYAGEALPNLDSRFFWKVNKEGKRYIRRDLLFKGALFELLPTSVLTEILPTEQLSPANALPSLDLSNHHIGWFFPPPREGSGGHQTIIRLANALAACGAKVSLFSPYEKVLYAGRSLQDSVNQWFGAKSLNVYESLNGISDCTFVFATTADSPEWLLKLGVKKEKLLYLAQDYEPYFFSRSYEQLIAEKSYEIGIPTFCLGRWLGDKLSAVAESQGKIFSFGTDQTIFSLNPAIPRQDIIAILYQPSKPRRMAGLLKEAIARLSALLPQTKIFTFGEDLTPSDIPQGCTNLGVLSPFECSLLYNVSRVGITLSNTNPSRIPFEMLACGLPVVELDQETTNLDFIDSGLVRASANSEDISKQAKNLLSDPTLWKTQHSKALEFSKGKDINFEINGFLKGFEKLL